MNFIDRKVSVNKAIAILAKNGIQVADEEATVILDLLYLIAKNYKRPQEKNAETPRRNRTSQKRLL